MKWINPGMAELFDSVTASKTIKSDTAPTGFYVDFTEKEQSLYKQIKASEIWFSYDFTYKGEGAIVARESRLLDIKDSSSSSALYVKIFKTTAGLYLGVYNAQNSLLYTSEKAFIGTVDNVWHNVEFHVKTGEGGRIDMWLDTKLFCSFRSPSAFNWEINKVGLSGEYFHVYQMYVSSFILQDTRRIGLEKFKKLTIDPDTEQNMPQGSTTTYKLSGLSDATEFSDITSVCAVLQATSRDANISTGTFSLEGADVGTIDVSDSSGKDYEIAHAEANSLTGKPWTRDDIEGKTLSFKVNGAS